MSPGLWSGGAGLGSDAACVDVPVNGGVAGGPLKEGGAARGERLKT